MKTLLSLAVLLLATFTAAAQAKKAGEQVSIQQVDFRGDTKPGSNVVAIVTVQIEKGLYLQSNRPPSAQLVRTDIGISAAGGVRVFPVAFSSGTPKTVPGFKDQVLVYEDSFTVSVPLTINYNAVLPATLPAVLTYQPTLAQGNTRQPVKQLRFNIVVPRAAVTPPGK